MKTIKIPDGIMTLAECKVECPKCAHQPPFHAIEDLWNDDDDFLTMSCPSEGCDGVYGVALDFRGDYVSFEK